MCCETVHYIIYKHFWQLSSRYSSFESKVKRCCKIGLRFCLQSKHWSSLASRATSGPAAESCPTAGLWEGAERGGVVGNQLGGEWQRSTSCLIPSPKRRIRWPKPDHPSFSPSFGGNRIWVCGSIPGARRGVCAADVFNCVKHCMHCCVCGDLCFSLTDIQLFFFSVWCHEPATAGVFFFFFCMCTYRMHAFTHTLKPRKNSGDTSARSTRRGRANSVTGFAKQQESKKLWSSSWISL